MAHRLSESERAALQRYAKAHGRSWKRHLLNARANGRLQNDTLWALVNRIGPSGIRAVSLREENPGKATRGRKRTGPYASGAGKNRPAKRHGSTLAWTVRYPVDRSSERYYSRGEALRRASEIVRLGGTHAAEWYGDHLSVRDPDNRIERSYKVGRDGRLHPVKGGMSKGARRKGGRALRRLGER